MSRAAKPSREQIHERTEDPFGHAPEHTRFEPVPDCPHESSVAGEFDRLGAAGEERVHREPPGVGDFGIEDEGLAGREREHERTDQNGREHRGPGGEIIEGADQLGPGEIDADLLEGFPPRGIRQPSVSGRVTLF